MDRSFLSRPEVIAASEAFVCVRLTSYENADEMAFLKDMFVGREVTSRFAQAQPEDTARDRKRSAALDVTPKRDEP